MLECKESLFYKYDKFEFHPIKEGQSFELIPLNRGKRTESIDRVVGISLKTTKEIKSEKEQRSQEYRLQKYQEDQKLPESPKISNNLDIVSTTFDTFIKIIQQKINSTAPLFAMQTEREILLHAYSGSYKKLNDAGFSYYADKAKDIMISAGSLETMLNKLSELRKEL